MILAVPTTIITGFLGAGKTTAILSLLAQKPAHERWAILVNEFGEIGIDGSLLQGQFSKAKGVFVREVPGGCMCCTAGISMQIALNQLLAEAKPHRLLIEPTGLGHPKEVLQVLRAEHYQPVLSLLRTITLVDARKLQDSKYTEHDTFNQQIQIADTIVGNKQDLYSSDDTTALTAYVHTHTRENTELIFTEQGVLSLSHLDKAVEHGNANDIMHVHTHEHFHKHHSQSYEHEHHPATMPSSTDNIVRAQNEGEGFESAGWRFAAGLIFSRSALVTLFSQLNAERMKAVFITDAGVIGFNLTADGYTEQLLDDCEDSRIELIARSLSDDLEDRLLDCVSRVVE